MLRYGFRPSKIAFLAEHAWADARVGEWPPNYPEDSRPEYDLAEIRHWLEVFLKRFFASQFKRSALPNGPKVSAGGTMSPRGDWRMPSDASPAAWLAELEHVPEGMSPGWLGLSSSSSSTRTTARRPGRRVAGRGGLPSRRTPSLRR